MQVQNSKYWPTILKAKANRPVVTFDHLRLLTKPGAIEVLRHTITHSEGSRFSDLNFDLRLNSGTLWRLLKELGEQGLISKVDQSYQATTLGKRALTLCTEVLSMRAPRTVEVAAGRRVAQ
jgi:DNA-binding HxlR family transcriptional regulator